MSVKDDFVPVESMLKMEYLEQYAHNVTSYSSRYNTTNSYSYAPVNLVGKYSKYPSYGDFPETYFLRSYGSWWRKSGAAQLDYRPQDFDLLAAEDYVILGFGSVVVPRDICIYEIYNPGAIIRIWGCYATPEQKWILLWEGFPQKCTPRSRKFCPPLRKVNCLVNVIRLEFNQSHLEYHTSIDAVLLGGYQPKFEPFDYGSSIQFHLIQKGLVSVKITSEAKPGDAVTFGEKTKTDCDNSIEIDYFSSIPHELILHIFQFLDLRSLSRCAQVNKKFNQICKDQSLYQCINLKIYWNLVNSSTLDYFLNRCHNLKKLDLSWCNGSFFSENSFNYLSKMISLLMQQRKTLTHLCLNDNYDVDDVVIYKIGRCDNLTELRLSHTEKWEMASLENLTRLVTLDLSMTNINDDDLCAILEYNPNLEYLIIDLCEKLEDLDCVVDVLVDYNRKLKGWSSWKTNSLTSDGIRKFSFCENLEELDLGWCLMNTDPGDCLAHIAAGCKKLKRLVLSEWRGVSDHLLMPVIRSCKELSQLDLLGIKNITAELCKKALLLLPKLRLLDISFCDTVRHDEVEIWRQQYPHITIQRSCQFVVTDYLN